MFFFLYTKHVNLRLSNGKFTTFFGRGTIVKLKFLISFEIAVNGRKIAFISRKVMVCLQIVLIIKKEIIKLKLI